MNTPSFQTSRSSTLAGGVLFLVGMVASVFLGASPASATIVFSDNVPLDASGYTSGANLAPQNPTSTTGFTTAWGTTGSTAYTTQSNFNLTMAGMGSNDTGTGAIRFSAGAGASRSFNRTFSAASSASTLWLGTLMDATSNGSLMSGSSNMVNVLSGALSVITSNSDPAAATWSSTNGGALKGFGIGEKNGVLTVDYQSGAGAIQETSVSGLNFTLGTTYFLIAKLDLNTSGTSDTLSVWFKAATPGSEAALGAADFTISTADIATSSSDLNRLVVAAGTGVGATTGQSYVDDLRLGTTYDDIVALAVPELSVWASLIVGVLALGVMTAWKKELSA